jgi:fatty-acyl-CoA synthase
MNDAPSFVRGGDQPPLTEETIGQALDRAVERWPDREVLVSVHQGIRWTYAEFGRRVDVLASALLGLGLEPGDRIAIWSPNCAEWALTQFATAKAGLVLVNVNPAFRTEEAAYTLNKTGAKALITASRFKSSDYIGMLRILAPELAEAPFGGLRAERLPHLRTVILIEGEGLPACLAFEDLYGIEGPPLPAALSNRGPINIQFTSGTTGLPKGATLSHRNILNNGRFVALSMGLRELDRLCIPVPLYHCFGMVMGNIACISAGATIIYASAAFDPLAVLETVQNERCTGLHGVPTMFISILEHPDFERFDLSSLRCGIMAGTSCPVAVMRRVIDRMHMSEVTIAYGMTETSPVSFQSNVDDPLEQRVASAGRIQPHLEVKLIDTAGQVVPRGTTGEVCTRGYSVMLGYWDDEAGTAAAVDADGWMHTGDLAVLDDEGYCRIVGRLKDMIIRGGENIYPREIEEFLSFHPKIEEVHIIGVPDTRFGEEVCAWVHLRNGEVAEAQDIVAYCRDRIAHYKIPRYVRFVDSFPLTVTGKVRKHKMVEEMIEIMGRCQNQVGRVKV